MSSAAIRQELHHIIDLADDAKVEAIYNIMRGTNASSEKYTVADLTEFYTRLDKYNKGEMPGFSVEEAHAYVRATACC